MTTILDFETNAAYARQRVADLRMLSRDELGAVTGAGGPTALARLGRSLGGGELWITVQAISHVMRRWGTSLASRQGPAPNAG